MADLDEVTEDAHKKYAKALIDEETMLVTLRDELYGKSWDKMVNDLKDRLNGRPYIPKLVSRIKLDLGRIETLRTYEREKNINLADYLKPEEPPATE